MKNTMKNTELLTSSFSSAPAKSAAAFDAATAATALASAPLIGAAVGGSSGLLNGLINARPGRVAQDSAYETTYGTGTGLGAGLGVLGGGSLAAGLTHGVDSKALRALLISLGVVGGGVGGAGLGAKLTDLAVARDSAKLEERRRRREEKKASNQELLAASFVVKEAMEKEASLGKLGLSAGKALLSGGANKLLSGAAKTWSLPMRFIGRGMGPKSTIGKALDGAGRRVATVGAKATRRARHAENAFAKDVAKNTAEDAAKKVVRRRAQKAMGYGTGAAGLAGLVTAPAVAGATGIPGVGAATNLAAFGPMWYGAGKALDIGRNVKQRGAQQATGALLNQMQNASFMDRMGYLMAPGAATGKVRGMANQYLPGFEKYYNQTYGG